MDRLNPFFIKQNTALKSVQDLESVWSARRSYWARKLGRIRLGVEPIEEQLALYRRVTWLLTAVPAFLGAFVFTLFAVFGRSDIGAVVAALLCLPIVAGAWIGYLRLEFKARRFLREQEDYERARERLQTQKAE